MGTVVIKMLVLVRAISALAELENPWKLDSFSAGERAMKMILELCYENNSSSNPTAIFGEFNLVIDELPIIRVNKSLNLDDDHQKRQMLGFKASNVVLIEDSPETLLSHLGLLKEMEWWNHMASFFIIGRARSMCDDLNVLNTTWNMDIINSILICPGPMDTPELYTLNPIANYAPNPWRRMERSNINIFRQAFHPDISCETLNYDKTKFFNGYEINVLILSAAHEIASPNDYFKKKAALHSEKVFHFITKTLNVTFKYEIVESDDSLKEHFNNGTSDLTLNIFPLESAIGGQFFIPYLWTEVIIIVKSSPELSTIQKILHLWSGPVLILAGIALAILLTILIISNHDFGLGLLDTTRLLTYVSIRRTTASHSFRIYMSTMLIFMIISNGVFQGKISAFLTKHERAPAAKSTDELLELGYKFYCIGVTTDFMKSRCPRCHVTTVSEEECIENVLNGSLNACVAPKFIYERNYALAPVDTIRESVISASGHHKCRDNWPLYDRINSIMMRIVESDLFNYWLMKLTSVPVCKRQAREIELQLPRYRPVELAKLDFAFELLAAGLAISAIVLILELKLAKYRIH